MLAGFKIIFQEKDLSLKDSAGYCLFKVAPAVCLKYQDVAADIKFLVSDTVLPLARAGIRDKNETVQQESVKLLGEMVSNQTWNLIILFVPTFFYSLILLLIAVKHRKYKAEVNKQFLCLYFQPLDLVY
jgi:hypothetical protein